MPAGGSRAPDAPPTVPMRTGPSDPTGSGGFFVRMRSAGFALSRLASAGHTVHDTEIVEAVRGRSEKVSPPFPDDWSVSGRRSGTQHRMCREAARHGAPSRTHGRFAAFRAGSRISFRFAAVVRERGRPTMSRGTRPGPVLCTVGSPTLRPLSFLFCRRFLPPNRYPLRRNLLRWQCGLKENQSCRSPTRRPPMAPCPPARQPDTAAGAVGAGGASTAQASRLADDPSGSATQAVLRIESYGEGLVRSDRRGWDR